MIDLDEMSVVITGSGQGIGREVALRLARAGANIVTSDIDLERAEAVAAEIRELGRRSIAVRANVTSAEDNAALVDAAVNEFGRLDLMVCNAGIVQVKRFLDVTPEEWDTTFAVNVRGTFLSVQAAARQMLKQEHMGSERPRGKIINMASIAGRYSAGVMAPILPHYRASKAAVISITHTASASFAPDITVNAVCPGLVATDMWKQIDEEWSAVEGWETGTAWKSRTADVPLGRPQRPDDVAGVIEFLASPAADYMTGQSINVDGGLTAS